MLPTATLAQQGIPASGSGAAAVVRVGRCTEPEAADLPRAFRNALRSVGIPVLTESKTVAPLGGITPLTLEDAQKALGDARDLFINGQVAFALAALQTLTEEVARLPPSTDRWQLEREALTSLAQVQLDQGRGDSDKAAAEATLRRIFSVDPDYVPASKLYPPSFRLEVEAVRKAVNASPTTELRVVVAPVGTGVVVGGRPMGPSPLSMQLPPGSYRVEGMWGYGGLPKTVVLDGSLQSAVQVELSKATEGSILPGTGPCVFPVPDRNAVLKRFAALLKVKRVYAVSSEPSGTRQTLVGQEFDVATGAVTLERREPVVPNAPATEAVVRLAELMPSPTPPPSINSGLRTWSYIVGAVGIAATAAGVVLFLKGSSMIDSLNSQYVSNGGTFPVGGESTFQSQNNTGKSYKTIGLAVGGVGLITLAAAATLFFVSADPGSAGHVAISPYFQSGGGGAVIAGRF